MKPGLLLSEAPEPRFEMFCTRFINDDNYKKGHCNKQFYDEIIFEKHMLEMHKLIPGKFNRGWPMERSWYSIDYEIREGYEHFTRLKFKLPSRPSRRWNCTEEEARNSELGNCWCGKTKLEFDGRQIVYCSKEHNDQWWIKTDYVGPHKNKFLSKNNKCTHCGKAGNRNWNTSDLEMDHIIAIVLGGHPWDERNLQALCSECHKVKTKSDVGILAWWRRDSNYDIGPIIPDPQTTLDEIFEYSFV